MEYTLRLCQKANFPMVFRSWYIYFQIVKILLKSLAFLAFGIYIFLRIII